ncbi:NOP5/NOP56 family protein [Natronorarus salvus]|uniref:NOP5/NOP56 family protein n=1 Tax=Natronorarus salvus TaxID=3117733 RepID=UPI002F2617CB
MGDGWFEGLRPGDLDGARAAIESGGAESPDDWPRVAVESGFAADEQEYYSLLHEVSITAAMEMVRERERADDAQLRHALAAMDDADRVANELAERVSEWAGSLFEEPGTGVEYARTVAECEGESDGERRLIALAGRSAEVADEAEELRGFVERQTPTVAPNLAALAGPVLAARLISLAGGLKPLARMPSGTVQVLGAEEALFAHLRGHAPSPKHGVIYVHEYVRGTHPENRGSAARALAGKLSIAARIDHYSGDRRPELDAELDDRIERIRSREVER